MTREGFRSGRRRTAGVPGTPASPDRSDRPGRQARAAGPARPDAGTRADAPAGAGGPARPAPALTIDALGKKCPVPIIMLADRIRDVAIGQIVEVLADDPAAKTDLPAWCALKSQDFVGASDLAAGWSFLVRRSY